MNKKKLGLIACILIVGLVCFGAGYAVGISSAVNFIAKQGIEFLKFQNISMGKAELIVYGRKLYSICK